MLEMRRLKRDVRNVALEIWCPKRNARNVALEKKIKPHPERYRLNHQHSFRNDLAWSAG